MHTHDEKKYRDARLSADWGWTEIWGMRFRFSTMYDAKNRGHSEKVSSIF